MQLSDFWKGFFIGVIILIFGLGVLYHLYVVEQLKNNNLAIQAIKTYDQKEYEDMKEEIETLEYNLNESQQGVSLYDKMYRDKVEELEKCQARVCKLQNNENCLDW